MEADTLMIAEHDVITTSIGSEKIAHPEQLDGRTIRVAHIYVQARVLINRCLQVSGFKLFEASFLNDRIRLID